MSEKTEHELIELLWGITEKLDKILTELQDLNENGEEEE
jgi:hypothetical protein